jgi:hypothetical protein
MDLPMLFLIDTSSGFGDPEQLLNNGKSNETLQILGDMKNTAADLGKRRLIS